MKRTEYRITGRLRCEKKRHVVDYNRKWSKEDVEQRFEEIKEDAEWEMERRQRRSHSCGFVSIGTEYHSDYDLLDLKIESREVTNWK